MKLVIALCVVMIPAVAFAQHRGADSNGAGTVASSSSSGGSGSGGGGGSSSGSGDSTSFSGGSSSFGHRTGNTIVPPNPPSANTNSGAFTNYSNLTSPAPEFARPRGSLPINTAFPKGSVPVFTPNTNGNVTFIVGTYNPWLYLYDGLYGMPFYGVFDPFVDFGYAGGQVWTPSAPANDEKGVLHLDVKPRDAEVYIDGALIGRANQFIGLFHKLRIEAGVHRLELRAPGYEPIVVNVRIQGGESMTYRGALEKIAR
jgi:hypothetical protein